MPAADRVVTASTTAQHYAVFLSYCHADNKDAGRQWASWLHQALEGYDVPSDLVGSENARGVPIPPSLYPVFRDEEELPADADLGRNIREALKRSDLLVVICSPRSVASRFVAEEIRYFKELGKADAILAFMIDGEPSVSGTTAAAFECFPEPLRFGAARDEGSIDWSIPTMPIAADARPGGKPIQGWTTGAAYRVQLAREGRLRINVIEEEVRQYEQRLNLAKLKIIAGSLAVPLGTLTKRDRAMQLVKARQRQRRLRGWLSVVTALAVAALGLWGLASRNQKEAEKQTLLALDQRNEAAQQRDRALRQVYLNTMRKAAEKVAAGEFYQGRKLLLTCMRLHRNWEWWYLIARCGPSTTPLSHLFGAADPALAEASARMKVRLDEIAASNLKDDLNVYRIGSEDDANQLRLEYLAFSGRGGTEWYAWRGKGKASVLLGGHYTGMGGTVPAAMLEGHDTVWWRANIATAYSNPRMVDGELIRENEDYVSSIRERYIVGELGEHKETSDYPIENGTWADDPPLGEDGDSIAFDLSRPNVVTVGVVSVGDSVGDKIKTSIDLEILSSKNIETESSTSLIPLSQLATPLSAPPSEEALKLVQEEKQSLPEESRSSYRLVLGNGANGPVILTTWNAGNVRLRQGSNGRVIGESLNPENQSDIGGADYGGRVAIIPRTNLVAGWFWWRGNLIAGVVDLENAHLVCRFEKADSKMTFAYQVGVSLVTAPNGSEAAFELFGRNDRLFAVWNLKSGRLIYGDVDYREDAAHLPSAFAWDPSGRFVAICRPGGVTELRRNFATPPFAFLEGVLPSRTFCIQEIDKGRVIVGNAVVDTDTWETVITIPTSNRISRNGDIAVFETRKGVVDVVRLAFRHASNGSQPRTELRLPERILLHQIREHDSHSPEATSEMMSNRK